MSGGEASVRKGMERARLRKPSLSQLEDARPRDPAFLAPSAKSTPPERKHPISKHPQTRQVSKPHATTPSNVRWKNSESSTAAHSALSIRKPFAKCGGQLR